MFSVEEARHKRPQLVESHEGEMSEAEKPQSVSQWLPGLAEGGLGMTVLGIWISCG